MATELANIKTILARLEAKYRTLQDQMAEVEQDKIAVERTIALLEEEIGLPTREYGQPGVTAADLRHCKNQPEAVRAYARLNNGVVAVTKAAKAMYDAELSAGKLSSLKSSVHRFLSDHPNEWDYVEPGVFRQKNAAAESDEVVHSEPKPQALDSVFGIGVETPVNLRQPFSGPFSP